MKSTYISALTLLAFGVALSAHTAASKAPATLSATLVSPIKCGGQEKALTWPSAANPLTDGAVATMIPWPTKDGNPPVQTATMIPWPTKDGNPPVQTATMIPWPTKDGNPPVQTATMIPWPTKDGNPPVQIATMIPWPTKDGKPLVS